MTKKTTMKPKSAETDSLDLCSFHTADGRRCGMLRWKRNRHFCLFHARQEQQLLHIDYIGNELPTLSGWFQTATDLNFALGNLFEAVARNRIPPRHAAVLAYISQLIIQTLPQVKAETIRIEGEESWDANVQLALDAQYGDEDKKDAESGKDSEKDSAQDSAPVDSAPPAERDNSA